MFEHGFPPYWSTIKKLIWLVGTGIVGGVAEIWKTVTGMLIHITDALEAPMQKCEVTLEPIQDLHGQDSPYPAGGWVNKLDLTDKYVYQAGGGAIHPSNYAGATNTLTETGFTSTSRDNSYGPKVYAGYYNSGDVLTFVCTISNGNPNIAYTTVEPATNVPYTNVTGTSGTKDGRKYITVTAPSDGYYYVGAYANNTTDIVVTNAELVVGDTVPSSYTPYSNICPITGWTGCEVTRTGKNLFDKDNATVFYGYLDNGKAIYASGQRVVSIPCEPNTTYTISKILEATTTANRFYSGWSENPIASNVAVNDINGISSGTKGTKVSRTITTGATAAYIAIWVSQSEYYTDAISTLQIEVGSTATDYEAYSGTTLSVTFPDTVYGGKYDFVGGSGDSKYKSIDMGTLEWQGASQNRFYATINDSVYSTDNTTDFYCSSYASKATIADGNAWFNQQRIYVVDSHYGTAAAFKTAMNGVQLVYPLAEPTEISLTPQEISTLAGENNIWGDGTITAIYKATE